MQEDIYRGDGLNLCAFVNNPQFNTPEDIERRIRQVPAQNADYGK